MAGPALIPVSRLLRYECPEDLSLMPERGAGHHCAACDKTVVDMGRLTLVDAVKARRAAGPGVCSSYLRQDGALVFRAARRAGGSVVISVAAFLAACESGAPPHEAAKVALHAPASASAAAPAPALTAPPPLAVNELPLDPAPPAASSAPSASRCAAKPGRPGSTKVVPRPPYRTAGYR
jgi:hypothetical protein